jgi:hypothetical protein
MRCVRSARLVGGYRSARSQRRSGSLRSSGQTCEPRDRKGFEQCGSAPGDSAARRLNRHRRRIGAICAQPGLRVVSDARIVPSVAARLGGTLLLHVSRLGVAISGRVIAVIGRAVRSLVLTIRTALKLLRLRGIVTGSCGGGIGRWWRCRVLRCHATGQQGCRASND